MSATPVPLQPSHAVSLSSQAWSNCANKPKNFCRNFRAGVPSAIAEVNQFERNPDSNTIRPQRCPEE